MMLELLNAADIRLFRLINEQWTHPTADAFFTFVTEFKIMMPIVAVLAAAGLWRGHWHERLGIALAALAVVLTDMVGATIKDEVARLRPFGAIEGARVLVGLSSSYSFPSNHAANCAAAALVVGVTWRRHPWLAVGVALLAACVAYSRIYVGVHFPLDVVAGIALGLTVGALVLAVTSRWPVIGAVPGAPWKGLSALVLVFSFTWRLCFAASTTRNLTPAEALAWAGSVSPGFPSEGIPWAFQALMRVLDAAAGRNQFVLHGAVAMAGAAVLMAFHGMGRAVTGGHRGGFLAVGLAASLPLWSLGSVLQLPATWSVILAVLAWAGVVRALREDRMVYWWGAAAAAGAAGLFSPYAAAAAAGPALGLVADGVRAGRRAVSGAAVVAVAAGAIAALTAIVTGGNGVIAPSTFQDLRDGILLGWGPMVALLAAGLGAGILAAAAHETAVRRLLLASTPPLVAAAAAALGGGDAATPLAMAAIPVTLAVAGYLDGLGDAMLPRAQRLARAATAIVTCASGLALSVVLISPDTRRDWIAWLPPQRDWAGWMVGWKRLAEKADNLTETLPADAPWRVEAEDRGVAALLRFYSMEPDRVTAPGTVPPPGPTIRVLDSKATGALMAQLGNGASCGEPEEHTCKSKRRTFRSFVLLPCSR